MLAPAELGLPHPEVSPDGLGAGGGEGRPTQPPVLRGAVRRSNTVLRATGPAGPQPPRCRPAQTCSLVTATPSLPHCHQHVAVASRVTPQTCPLPQVLGAQIRTQGAPLCVECSER